MPLAATNVTHALRGRTVLDGLALTIEDGESIAVLGPSGVGKSTLLACLAGLIVPDSGTISWNEHRLSSMAEAERDRLRLRHFGFVFQFGELLPELTAVENVELPLLLTGRTRREARRAALEILDELDIAGLADEHPERVSGGEAQRVAVARALVHRPAVVFADEPTGSLDEANKHAVMSLVLKQCEAMSTSLVIVTHDAQVAGYCQRAYRMAARSLEACS